MELIEAMNRKDTHSVLLKSETSKLDDISSEVKLAETLYLIHGTEPYYQDWLKKLQKYAEQHRKIKEYLTPYIY